MLKLESWFSHHLTVGKLQMAETVLYLCAPLGISHNNSVPRNASWSHGEGTGGSSEW